jgi:UrcA family protein
MNRLTPSIMILTLGLTSQFANAADPPTPAVEVSFKDLSLTHTEGAAKLYQRLQSAAEKVCESADGQDIARRLAFKACVHGAVATAVAKVDNPQLTAYYRLRSDGRTAAAIQVAHNNK